MPVIVPKPWKQKQREFADEVWRLAELTFERYCRSLTHVYLVGAKETGLDTHNPLAPIWRRFSIATADETDERPELLYVHPEPMPRNRPLNVIAEHIREILSREPMYIFAD